MGKGDILLTLNGDSKAARRARFIQRLPSPHLGPGLIRARNKLATIIGMTSRAFPELKPHCGHPSHAGLETGGRRTERLRHV